MKQSAGILPYKLVQGEPYFFIAHPGGPYYRNKDAGSWSIVKGELAEGEEALQAAIREFTEETGLHVTGPLTALTAVKQKSGKLVHAWAVEQDFATDNVKSNTFTLEWPPRSGKMVEFPEMDRFAWFDEPTTLLKLLPGQLPFVHELLARLKANTKK